MFCLEHKAIHVCQRNVALFVHVECRFNKIKDIFQGFGSLVSLGRQKDGDAKVNKFGQNYHTGMRSLIIDSVQVCRSPT